MFGIREVVKTKFEVDEQVREARARQPVQWWALEVIALVAGIVALVAVIN